MKLATILRQENRKGVTQADWAISLGIFILYLAFVFIMARPLLSDQLPDSGTSLLLDTYLTQKAYIPVITTPYELTAPTSLPLTILPYTGNDGISPLHIRTQENTTFDFVASQSLLFIFQRPWTQKISLLETPDHLNHTDTLGPTGHRTNTTYSIIATETEAEIPDADTEIHFNGYTTHQLHFQGTPIIRDWQTMRSGNSFTRTNVSLEQNGFLAIYDTTIIPSSSNPSSAEWYPIHRTQYVSAEVSGLVTVLHPYTKNVTLSGSTIPDLEYTEQMTLDNLSQMITPTQTTLFTNSCQTYSGSSFALTDGTQSLVFYSSGELIATVCHANQTTELNLTYQHSLIEPFWFSLIATDQTDELQYIPQSGQKRFSQTQPHLDLISLTTLKERGTHALHDATGIPQENKIRLELLVPEKAAPENGKRLFALGPQLPREGDVSATSQTVPLLVNTTTIPYAKLITYTWI